MKKIVFPIIISISLVLASSCKKDDNTQPAPGPTKETLKTPEVGNRWVYDFVYNNNVADSLVIEVLSKNGEEYEIKTADMQTSRLSYRFIEDDYLKDYPKTGNKSTALRLMKNDAKVGDTWTDFDGSDSVYTTVKSIDSSVTVPAGTFTCVQLEIKTKSTQGSYTNYVNYKAGLVKIDITSGANKYEYKLRSKNF